MSRDALALAFFCATLAPLGCRDAPAPSALPDVAWEAALGVEEHLCADEVVLTGWVTFVDDRHATVASPLAGRVERVLVRVGEQVRKGQPLAIVASPEHAALVAGAAAARSRVSRAERERERAVTLHAHAALSARALEDAIAEAAKASAEWQRSEAAARRFGSGARLALRAPIAGEVLTADLAPGLEVGPAAAQPLYTIGARDELFVSFALPPALADHAHAADPVGLALAGRRLDGRIERLASVLDPETRTRAAAVRVRNDDGALRPGMAADVHLALPQRALLSVPRPAVLHAAGFASVWVLGADGRAEARAVEVEDCPRGAALHVLGGLSAGERVLVGAAALERVALQPPARLRSRRWMVDGSMPRISAALDLLPPERAITQAM